MPSDLLFIDDDYVAYCLNEAVYQFGLGVENRLRKETTGKSEKDRERSANLILNRILQVPEKRIYKSFGPPRT